MVNDVKACRQKDSGFTLIEMIVVVIILGILATIAVISLTSANRTSQVAACKADYKAVYAALSSYRNDRVEDLQNLDLGYPGGSGSGDSLISLKYMVPLVENGSYRIYLTPSATNVSVQVKSSGSWSPVPSASNSDADCDAISSAGQ